MILKPDFIKFKNAFSTLYANKLQLKIKYMTIKGCKETANCK